MINSASPRSLSAPDKQINGDVDMPDGNDIRRMTFTRTVRVNDNIMPSGADLSNKPENFISNDQCTPDTKAVSNAHRKISLMAYEKPTPTTAESTSVHHTTRMETSSFPIIDLPFIKSIEIPVKTALLQEYHPSSFLPPSQTIARPIHGLQHSCRTAIWALAILQQRKQQQDPRALNFPEHLVPLLVKACLFHDSGREGDGKDTTEWEKASSDNLQEHLRNCGIEQSLAWQCGEAIRHKDRPDACKHLPWEIQTLRSLLHDADTLEVMRVRSYFYIDKLECFAACHDDQSREAWRLLAREVCRVIAGQGDLWSTIDLQDNAKTVINFFSQTATGCVNTKKQWEHHPSPLEYQLFTISTQSDFISKLITPFTGLPVAPEPTFSLARLNRQSESLGGSKIGQLYNDPVQQQCYYIKTAVSVESACNQALMANLARLLGVNAPVTFAHQEQGCSYVVSEVPADWPGNLKSGKAPLQSLPANQWARLLLVNTIVGNEAMVNEDWENIELTPQGEPVMLNWEFAGMATRYPCPDKPEPTSKEDDFSSMPVLLIKLRDPRAPAMNSHVIHNPCVAILSQLDDELLGQTLKTMLREVDWQALDQQIEHSGFLPGDRSWLRQTIHDRIAWLTTRFANSVEAGERVSMAEYQAIAAAGIRGGWLQVKGPDIRGGQLCLTQRLDQDGKPITRMTLQLARNASNRLAYNLALEQGLHHLNTWINYLQCHHQSDSYRDWRSDLASLADECDQLAQQLIRDKERWNPSDHDTIDKAIKNLQTNVATCRESLEADRLSIGENSLNLIQLPEPAFPARVCSRAAENIEAKVQLAEFSHGFARQTGQSASYFNKTQLNYAGLHASPVRVAELKPVSQEGHIEFIPEWLPEARALQNSLALTLPGHDKSVVEALFSELAGLGIHCQRPDASDLEERWLDALANYHGCLGDMNRAAAADTNADASVIARKKAFLEELLKQPLRYEEQLRFRAGRLIYFLPGLPHDIAENPARSFCPGHNVSFLGKTDSKETVMASLKNYATLCSFERRMDIGLEPVTKDMKRQANVDARDVFARIQPVEHKIGHSLYGGQLSALFKSETLGRLDLCAIKDHCIYHDFHPGLETFRRNIKTILQSHGDYQEVMKAPYHEIFFTDSLSLFDELKTLHVSSSEDRLNLLHALKRRYSHWPDGRPLEALFQYSRSTRYYELISVYSRIPGNIKMLIKAFGEEGFELLLQQNPGLLEGKLQSLDGLKTTTDTSRKLIGLDFRGCSMNDTEFERTKFKQCKFTMEHLNNASLESTFFKGCSFEGECFSLSVLKNAKFEPERIINNKKVTDNIPKLSQAISQSCINSQGQFNLELWLDVMEKNNYLLRPVVKKDLFWTHIIGWSPADETTKKILEEQIDNIIRMHPERLQFIVESFFRIKMNNVENISNFVKNNPKFYERKIVNVRDFYFDFKTSIHREEGEENQEYKKRFASEKWFFLTDVLYLTDPSKDVCSHAPREEVLALIVNIIEFVMFPLEHEYIEFGINANDGGNQKSGKNFRSTENNTMSCFELDHEYQNMMDKFKAEICYQHILEKCRNHFTKIWESCSDETRLEIAKCCLKNRIIAVSHLTTVEFMKLLIINQQGKHWLDDFTANMDKHKKNEHECNLSMKKWLWGIKDYDSTKIDQSLKAFEQWIKAEAPDFTRRLSGNDLPYYGSENSLLFSE
ncbi:pentapeptide repeat-containing protein [Thalassotalea sp. G20_0]|uniref:pentapeptide repeat-containing protein n=1 Tax=Thalassotalea sp. G20_0 TaxID=2821093 RepID=UPI001ADC3063|nr:pentapeptide repeat-containing protein [Thalassotalea sp. G20_0]MBO9494078.1 pentapeptide repeat-containing protein [Thalassotalea sp. G20_0]